MEYLALSANGQWTLHKNTNDHDADSVAPHTAQARPFNAYQGHAMSGTLNVDHDTRGELHDFGGGTRPKAEHTAPRRVGKPVQPEDSMYSDRHPGDGIE